MQMIMDIDSEGFNRAFDDFRSADKIATRKALDIAAAKTRRMSVADIKDEFILRNGFTKRNIVYDRVHTNDKGKMQSKIGATTGAAYMELQHNGGIAPRDNFPEFDGTAVPDIPARRSRNFRKPVSTRYNKLNMRKKLLKPVGGKHRGTPKSKRVAGMFMAYKKKKLVLMKNAIYKINSIQSKNGKIKANTERIYAIKRTPTVIQPTNWLKRHAIERGERIGENYVQQIRNLWVSGKVI